MEKEKVGFFEETKGHFSITRLMTFIIVVAPVLFLAVQAVRCESMDWTGAISMISVGMLGKVTQKVAEKKQE
jgi:hypothetical protein